MKMFFSSVLSFMICTLGFVMNLRMKKRVVNLEKCVVMFEMMEAQISFSPDNVTNIMMKINENVNLNFLNHFLSLDAGINICRRWEESVKSESFFDCFKSEEMNVLLSYGQMLGTTHSTGQIKNCEAHRKMMSQILKRAREKSDKNGNIFTFLGFLGAISVIVLLI